MNLIEIYRAVTRLLNTGWTVPEIERLSHFRNRFQQKSEDLQDFNLDIKHMEFIRWLFQTGKLSEW